MNHDSFMPRRCALSGANAVEANSRRSFPRHRHDSYGIGLITNGAQRSWSGRGSVVAERGNLITCNPEEVHDGVPIGDVREWKILYLAPQLVGNVVADIRDGGARDFEFADPVIKTQSRAPLFATVYDAMTGPDAHSERAHELLIVLLTGLIGAKTRVSVSIPPELVRAKSRIDDDPAAHVTLEELASECGVSRFQLVRGFAKMTGFTPHAYLLQRRLEIARPMIASGVALADVAASCGFADQSHFTRAFVGRYGITPGVMTDHTKSKNRSENGFCKITLGS